MPYTTLVAGTTITASWANSNVRDQVVTPFATASARDSAITSPVNGMLANITDDDLLTTYNGASWVVASDYGAWDTWAPTLSQSGTVTHTATIAKYSQVGKTIVGRCVLAVTGTGTAGTAISVTLPVAALTAGGAIGACRLIDASTAIQWAGTTVAVTTTTLLMVSGNGTVTNAMGTAAGGFTAGLANGDTVEASFCYEAA